MTKNALALTFAALLLGSGAPVLAAEIGCEGVFGEDTTLTAIEAEFGKQNVVTGEVPGPEGTTMIATTIFPGDAEREMQVRWWDEEKVTHFAGVTLAAGDTGPKGIRLGMTIDEVEALNGEPFQLLGFYWDYGGSAGFETGALSDLPGDCHLNLRLLPTVEDLPQNVVDAISGDTQLTSDMAELREAKVTVQEVNLGYPFPEELMPAE